MEKIDCAAGRKKERESERFPIDSLSAVHPRRRSTAVANGRGSFFDQSPRGWCYRRVGRIVLWEARGEEIGIYISTLVRTMKNRCSHAGAGGSSAVKCKVACAQVQKLKMNRAFLCECELSFLLSQRENFFFSEVAVNYWRVLVDDAGRNDAYMLYI